MQMLKKFEYWIHLGSAKKIQYKSRLDECMLECLFLFLAWKNGAIVAGQMFAKLCLNFTLQCPESYFKWLNDTLCYAYLLNIFALQNLLNGVYVQFVLCVPQLVSVQ